MYWCLLVGSALFFTTLLSASQILDIFGKAINVVRGKYDDIDHAVVEPAYGDVTPGGDSIETIRDESQEGEVSHFQALATAVSGTVGNGNIAGVALAIALRWSRSNILDDSMWSFRYVYKICGMYFRCTI